MYLFSREMTKLLSREYVISVYSRVAMITVVQMVYGLCTAVLYVTSTDATPRLSSLWYLFLHLWDHFPNRRFGK